jgi:pyruvate,orthophosphate dikinase
MAWFQKEMGLKEPDKRALQTLFDPLSHRRIEGYLHKLEGLSGASLGDGDRSILEGLVALPGYGTIVDRYRRMPSELQRAAKEPDSGDLWKLVFLFHIMNIAGLSLIHEETLRDINFTMAVLIGRLSPPDVRQLIKKTFEILKSNMEAYPETALNTILNMGKAVYKTDESELVDYFIDAAVSLGFQTPNLRGTGDDWQIRANRSHIKNIRNWMDLIGINPKWSKKLLSSLTINLALFGVFIRDTDLFPRDITNFLNTDIGLVYNLAKQLARLFPAYFNDIGAEGHLRDISTRIDEVCQRKDALVHFLRKQSHVESSNRIVDLMEAVLDFWRTKDKGVLQPYLPPNIYQEVAEEGPYIDGVHTLIRELFAGLESPKTRDLLGMGEAELEGPALELKGLGDSDRERVRLAVSLYRLLYQKYHLGFTAMEHYLAQLQTSGFFDPDRLKGILAEPDTIKKLNELLTFLEDMKALILSKEHYEIREDIYRKRHFAVDIPSMYGSYRETKFDALGLSFRLESLANVLFEDIVDRFNLQLVTRATISRIHEILRLFYRALQIDGIHSREMEKQLDLLDRALYVRRFSFTQFLDIFRGFLQAVKNIVNDYFNNIHQRNLFRILERLPADRLLTKYLPREGPMDRESLNHRVTEIFIRDQIAASLGLQQLDLFLSRILNTLHQQSDKLPPKRLRRLLDYDPQKATTPLSPVEEGVSDIIYLGNKGLNLARLTTYGFPVPPAFIITTEFFRCREVIDNYPPAMETLRYQIRENVKVIEKMSRRVFGDPSNPLLFSVRSGAPISQPGMMDTFLDVGMNEEIAEGIAIITGNDWFAWDCYRRFLQSYGMAFGMNRDDFDDIILTFKRRLGIPFKREFSGKQMKQIALEYWDLVSQAGIKIEASPYDQLFVAGRKKGL